MSRPSVDCCAFHASGGDPTLSCGLALPRNDRRWRRRQLQRDRRVAPRSSSTDAVIEVQVRCSRCDAIRMCELVREQRSPDWGAWIARLVDEFRTSHRCG